MSESTATQALSAPSPSTFTGAIRIHLREPARMRNLELVLLLVACAIDAGAIVLVQLGTGKGIDVGFLALTTPLTVLALVMHVVMRVTAKEADPFILPIITLLNGLGIAEIYRIDLGKNQIGWDSLGVKQIVWTAIAMALAIAVLIIVRNHRALLRYRYIWMLVGIVMLALPALPGLGKTVNGAHVWVGIGGVFSFQPGEFAKVALAIFFAGYLVTTRESLQLIGPKIGPLRLPRPRDLGPIAAVFLLSVLVLVVQRDLGTSLLYFGLFLVMIYLATGRASWIVIGLVPIAIGAVAAATLLPYVSARIDSWINAFSDSVYHRDPGGSFQIVQGLFGLANGGLIGTGLGEGQPGIVPYARSDYIIASLGEELGLIGLFAILGLYLLFVSRGFRIGFAAQDDFGRLLGAGLAFVIALQIFIVIGGVTRVIPLTGLTTPFLAAGGSSLVANWIIAALLLRLSDTVRRSPGTVIE